MTGVLLFKVKGYQYESKRKHEHGQDPAGECLSRTSQTTGENANLDIRYY